MASESIATKEREPAPAEAGASSKNICTKRSHSYDSTLLKKCQDTWCKVCFNLLDTRDLSFDISDSINRQIQILEKVKKIEHEIKAARKEFEEIMKCLKGEDEDDTAGI